MTLSVKLVQKIKFNSIFSQNQTDRKIFPWWST